MVIELLKRGGKVVVGSRNPEEALKTITKAIGKIKSEPRILVKKLDLTSLKSVRKFAESLGKVSKLLNE